MQQYAAKISIPESISFADLNLTRNPDGSVGFDWTPIGLICKESGIPIEVLTEESEDNVSGLLMTWYLEHRKRGGAPDPVAEDLLAEVMAEDENGGGISHQPGRA